MGLLNCNKIRTVKNTIKHWVRSRDYPKEFQEFFSKWVLLNRYYNKISDKDHERDRVLDFGRKYENLFDLVTKESS